MGAAETFEPTLTSLLAQSTDLSSGMSWLSVSRSIGQFLSNLIVGLLFVLSQFASYFYAFAADSLATAILLMTEQWTRRQTLAEDEANVKRHTVPVHLRMLCEHPFR